MKKKIRWSKFLTRGRHPVLANNLFWQSFIIQPKITGLPKLNFYKRDIKSTYFEEKELKKLLHILKSQLKNKPDWLFEKLQKIEKISQSLICLAQNYNLRNWQKVSSKELRSKLLFFLKRLIPLFCSAYYPLWLEQAGTELLQELFKKIKIEREKIIWQITRPYRLTTREKFNLALLTSACDLKKSKNSYKKLRTRLFQNKIEKLIKNFGFLPTYLLNVKFYNKKEIENEIKNLLLGDPCQKRIEKLQLLKQQQKTRKLLLKDLDSKIRKIADVLSFDVWLREERIAWYGRIFSLVYPLFCEMAKRRGITYQEFVQQTISEIKTGDISYQELQDRLKGYTYLVKNNVVTILPYKRKKIKVPEKIKIIKGQIANPGKAKGKVRIGTAYTFHQIKSGEVIVTGMTTPEATTFFRKVAAIVTDEGGISCHAAIISRELKIPCIIGTKIATKVLKDGDEVEVDANKGIVKILKKS